MPTIDEAIEGLTKGLPAEEWVMTPKLKGFVQLSIEALKAHKIAREPPFPPVPYLLPGERKETRND